MLRRKPTLTMILAPIRQHPLRLGGGLLTALLCFFLLQYGETASWRIEVNHWPVLTLVLLFSLFASWWLSSLNDRINMWLNWQLAFAARFVLGFCRISQHSPAFLVRLVVECGGYACFVSAGSNE